MHRTTARYLLLEQGEHVCIALAVGADGTGENEYTGEVYQRAKCPKVHMQFRPRNHLYF